MPEWLEIARRLVSFLAPYKKHTVLAYAAMGAVTALTLAVPGVLAWVVDRALVPEGDRPVVAPSFVPGVDALDTWARGAGPSLLLWAAGLLVLLAVVRAAFAMAQLYLGVWLSQQVALDLRRDYFDTMEHQSFGFHDRTQTGDLMSRAVADISKVQAFVGEGLLEAINTPLLFVGTVVVLFTLEPQLALVTMVPLALLVWVTVRFGRTIEPRFKAVQDQEGVISTRAQENFTGARVVKAFAREPFEIERFTEANEIYLERRISVIAGFADFFPTMTAIVTAAIGVVLVVGGPMAIAGEITLGTLVGFTFWVLMLAQPTQNLGFLVNRGAEAIAAGRRLFEVFDVPRDIVSPPDAIILPALECRVTFDCVSFGYRADQPVLHEIDLDVGPDEIIALFGPTGAGKSSLVSLIPRFYDVTSGRVLVDGHDVRNVDLSSLRGQIGFVRQDAFTYSATIRDNILYGLPQGRHPDGRVVTTDELEAAARAAQAHEFITALPNDYDTLVGERGVTLSGGQRQRLAIARALVKRPRVLVLDDAMSAVDTETEAQIQQALATWMAGRTTFLIAQRLLTLKHADMVIVLDGGRIVERGTHDELVVTGGLYQRIYEMQLAEQEMAAQRATDSSQ